MVGVVAGPASIILIGIAPAPGKATEALTGSEVIIDLFTVI
jgi:hypothetical protein